MITNTRNKIIDYIHYHGQARVEDLHKSLQISKVAVHKQLRRLLIEGLIMRVGKPPVVFYKLPPETPVSRTIDTKELPVHVQQVIDANFLSITPDGRLLYGLVGFMDWANIYQKNKSIEVVAREYADIFRAKEKLFSPDGYVDATSKLLDVYGQTPITHLFFEDIYSYKTFGRTKLAKLVMYAKQTGEKELIDQISRQARPIVEKIIKKYLIDAVVFIPPTVPRPIQFMDELKSSLNLHISEIKFEKVVPGDIPIAQKTLSSLSERVINARDSMYLRRNSEQKYKKVLLIDDVVGSGASFNEVAKKLAHAGIGSENIIAFALVGNIKGYEVIREI